MSAERRTIKVDSLARVEGEGALTIAIAGGRVEQAQLRIFEPPRFFEAFLRGRSSFEAPDLTARICGICPVAYMMSACQAIERAWGVRVDGGLRELRRLLYAGEWIESHALHVFLLHAPDFLGYRDSIAMARDHGEWVRAGLRMKKAGNAILSLLGGRAVHPVNVRIGGFYRLPDRAALEALLPELRWGRAAAGAALGWVAGFPFPHVDRDYEFVALRHPDEYAVLDGRLISSAGLDVDVEAFEQAVEEQQVPYSTALQSRIVGRGPYLCGPLARFNLNVDRLSPAVAQLARDAGLSAPCRNPFKAILVRLVEIAHAFEQAIAIIEAYTPPADAGVPTSPRAGTGWGGTEAPRGFLYHRYEVNDRGDITVAKIVPPTAQNQAAIEQDLFEIGGDLARLPLDAATRRAEQAIRNHDPCISCATHFLRLRFETRG